MDNEIGYTEGDVCNRRGCKGVIKQHPVENCSCHINAPCSACTKPSGFCPVCGWEESDDQIINNYAVNVNPQTGIYRTWGLRPLDKSKIDWHSFSLTNSSMLKRGVYPEGTSRSEVEAKVRGTFGGRFKHFGNGAFEYVAYTD